MPWLLLIALLIWSGTARADAVPPAPDSCPSGEVPVTDHGGPRCELAPPTDCPPGWRGIVGGTCAVHVCADDAQCQHDGAAKRCEPATLCYERREQWHGQRAPAEAPAGPLIAAPPIPLDEPRIYWAPINVCGAGAACTAPNECRPANVCVPAGRGATPLPNNPDGSVQTQRKPSGCGSGCATGRGPSLPQSLSLSLSLAMLGVIVARRRTRDERLRSWPS